MCIRNSVAGVIAAWLILALSGCAAQVGYTSGGPVPDAGEERYIEPIAQATGVIVLEEPVRLSFPTDGTITELLVRAGSTVQAGDIIARLDTSVIDAEVARAEASLEAAEAELMHVQAGPSELEITAAENELAAAEFSATLTPNNPALAAALAAAQARLEYLQSLPRPEELAAAEARVDEARAEVQAAEAHKAQAVMRAPIDGTVINLFAYAGEFAGVGQPIVEIGDLSKLCVDIKDLNEVDLAKIQPGDVATVTFNALPGMELSGEVTSITPWGPESSEQGFTVRVSFDEIPDDIRLGMTADVTIPLE